MFDAMVEHCFGEVDVVEEVVSYYQIVMDA